MARIRLKDVICAAKLVDAVERSTLILPHTAYRIPYTFYHERSPMLTTTLLHPEILAALGAAGHGSRVLIADGNYPFSTGAHPAAKRVYLNLAPGLLTAPAVLGPLTSAIPIEAAHVMVPPDGQEPAVFAEFRALLPGMELTAMERFAFYDAARSSDTALVIATAEQRVYANILLTIGVRV